MKHKHKLVEFYSIDGESLFVCNSDDCEYSQMRHDPCTCDEMVLVGSKLAEVTCAHEIQDIKRSIIKLKSVLSKVRDRLSVVVDSFQPWTDVDRTNLEYLEGLIKMVSSVLVKGDKDEKLD